MKLQVFAGATAGLAAVANAAAVSQYKPACTTRTDRLNRQALSNLASYVQGKDTGECTYENASVRKEWGSLSVEERIAYTDAVQCLQKLPSRLDQALYPGAKTRYDDFVAIHINQTFSIHATANFLSWHRYFTWQYEQALRSECGYEGYQPYWNWGRWAKDPIHSPLFDGSAGSMGSNGAYVPHECTDALGNGLNCVPDQGTGGGCVTSGPFKDMTVNLGPLGPSLRPKEGAPVVPVATFFEHNPRCLRRNVSPWVSTRWGTEKETSTLIDDSADIATFQNVMQGDFTTGFYGVHTAGHYTIGGDPGGDFFVSPGDPAFFLHHAQIDRVWWMWQNQKPEERTNAIAGTITLFNDPPSRNGTLDDIIDMSVNNPESGPTTIGKLMSTVGLNGSPMCYIYV